MASVGKVVGALTSVSNEVTLAVAAFNMDFTLMKFEAPKEYQGLGSVLSSNRREKAEAGTEHTTARKLAALFEPIIPETPNLYAAYGERASEIAKAPAAHASKSYIGPFSAHVGPDGTSIWAAATSGKRAISIHLLACMLSKLFKGPEAISVWVELVARRKSEIMIKLDSGSLEDTSSILAAQQEITRAHLSAWDASSRAWLLTADEAQRVRQTQLRLVLDNINVSVNNHLDLYKSVLKAWTDALVMIEKLVSGIPQAVHDGAALLALTSWHIYPDMLVLGSKTARIEQNDELVGHGGILTIGLHQDGNTGNGVFWSLPLSYMRYYGDATIVSRGLAEDSSRISFEQLYQVILGSLSAQWSMPADEVVRFIATMRTALKTNRQSDVEKPFSLSDHHWFSELSEAAVISQKAWGQNKESFTKLNNFGARRGSSFLNGDSTTVIPNFGLRIIENLLKVAKGPEAKVKLLRNISKSWAVSPNDIFIRYQPDTVRTPFRHRYASALPHTFVSRGNTVGEEKREEKKHIRWTYQFQAPTGEPNPGDATGNTIIPEPLLYQQELVDYFRSKKEKCYFLEATCIRESKQQNKWPRVLTWKNYTKERYDAHQRYEELKDSREDEWIYPGVYTTTQSKEGDENNTAEFRFLVGDFDTAAIFVRKPLIFLDPARSITTEDVIFALREDLVDLNELDKYLCTWAQWIPGRSPTPEENVGISLRNLAAVKALYDELSYATVNLAVVLNPIHKAKWIKHDELGQVGLDLPERFSCIARFESGNFDIETEHLRRVMALAVGNSIYIAKFLTSEPINNYDIPKIARVTGSLGRSEMAMLVPTQSSRLKPLDCGNWNVVKHESFDGKRVDSFQNTTLHLSFTDFEIPIDLGTHGIRDTEAIILEAVVSLHDRGRWVADLDVMTTLTSKYLVWDVPNMMCPHSNEEKGKLNTQMAACNLVSIDTWDELLDIPPGNIIIRAQRNWLARLAAATISVEKRRVTIFLDPTICFYCPISPLNVSPMCSVTLQSIQRGEQFSLVC